MVKVGIEVLVGDGFSHLKGKRIGLFTNPSAVNKRMVSTYQLMLDAEAVNVVALFAAEHGVFGAVQDGEQIDTMVDSLTGIPVRSIYGNTYRPSAEMLSDIDVMVCDVQDIGVRYYTYQWTVTHIIEACGEQGIPVMVLDRPNPLGESVAGRGLTSEFASFVGRFDVPIQHGMTLGELAQMHNAEWNPTPAELTVIACEGYQRGMSWEETGCTFVSPSPNMPQMATVRQYAGSCLIEGTTLSEGRGTTLPFEIVGAPYMDSRALAESLNDLALGGVRFRPHVFTPIARKYMNEVCEGVQVHMMGAEFEPIVTWVTVIHTIKQMYPEAFGWIAPYKEGDHPPIDKLSGSDQFRLMIDAGASVAEIMHGWDTYASDFLERRQPYLIYE